MNPVRNNHRILKWISPLIPPIYQRNLFMYGKIQAYMICLMGITVFGAFFALLSKTSIQKTEHATLHITIAFALVIVNIIALLALRITKRLWISYTLASISSLIVLDIISFDTGGLHSTTLLWTIFIPIGASLLLNIRLGIVWSIVIVLNAFIFFIIEKFYFPAISLTIEDPIIRVIDFAFVFIGILTVIFLFEKGRFNLYNRLLRTNREVRKQNEKLNQLNKEKEQLMSVVAHDLKSPLNTVSTIMNVLELSDNLTEEQMDCINSTRDLISSANNLIRDLLYSHEIKEINLEQKKTFVSLGSLVEKTVASFQTVAEAKRIKINVQVKDSVLEINTYPDFIYRILDNLLSNAVKFSTFDKTIHVSCKIENDDVFFTIRDEGPGITPDDQKKLFMRFQKLSARPTGGESSNGLGLAIVKSLVDILKGEISVSSTIGGGTAFTVRMPAELKHQKVS